MEIDERFHDRLLSHCANQEMRQTLMHLWNRIRIFRAYVADLVEEENRATAYGLLNTGIGLALLPASLIFGAVWDAYGSAAAFFVAAGLSTLGFVTFLASLTLRKSAGRPAAERVES